MALASRRPDLVAGLIIEDAPLWLRRFTVKAGSDRAYTFFKSLHQLCLETQDEAALRQRIPTELPQVAAREAGDLASRLARLDPDVLQMSFDSSLMNGFDIDVALAEIVCPALVFQADVAQGGSLGDEDAQAALRLLQRGTGRTMAGSGHAIHRDRPAEMATLILDWLKENKL